VRRRPPCASAPYRAATPFEDPPQSVEPTMSVSDPSSPRGLEVVPCWRSQSRPSSRVDGSSSSGDPRSFSSCVSSSTSRVRDDARQRS
jgi:hypothetical protein